MRAITQSYPPAVVLGALGVLSGSLGTQFLGAGLGVAPAPGLYMVLAGVWFGLVVAFGIWNWGSASVLAALATVATTWISWELAVNTALQLDGRALDGLPIAEAVKPYIGGIAAGAVGAFGTWCGAAYSLPLLRRIAPAAAMTATGAVFGMLLPWTSHYDNPAVLLVPWQCAVAALLGFYLAPASVRPPGISGLALEQ